MQGVSKGLQADHCDQRVLHLVSIYLEFSNFLFLRRISHPSLVHLDQIASKSHPDCSNVAEVSSMVTKESKTVVWLTAKDQSE